MITNNLLKPLRNEKIQDVIIITIVLASILIPLFYYLEKWQHENNLRFIAQINGLSEADKISDTCYRHHSVKINSNGVPTDEWFNVGDCPPSPLPKWLSDYQDAQRLTK